jgi:hypothetical protein
MRYRAFSLRVPAAFAGLTRNAAALGLPRELMGGCGEVPVMETAILRCLAQGAARICSTHLGAPRNTPLICRPDSSQEKTLL